MGDYLTSFPENSKYIVSLDHFKQKQKGTNLYLKLYCSLKPTQTKRGMEYLGGLQDLKHCLEKLCHWKSRGIKWNDKKQSKKF